MFNNHQLLVFILLVQNLALVTWFTSWLEKLLYFCFQVQVCRVISTDLPKDHPQLIAIFDLFQDQLKLFLV
jgi:hypothetical protein